MKISILTLFPEIIEGYFTQSIMRKAVERGIISYTIINFRDYAADRHKTVDDMPYGGGAGMVLKCDPLAQALDHCSDGGKVICPNPSGSVCNQKKIRELAAMEQLVFICGRYEGIDQRIIDTYVDDELSVGDYVLSSGEIASLVIIDAVYRLLDGVINRQSLVEESHDNGLLEYPHYTRPETFRGQEVPRVLLSGHHEHIRRWRRKERLRKTFVNRPELLAQRALTEEDKSLLEEIRREETYGSHSDH